MSGGDEERDAYLRAQLEPDEEVVATGPAGMVTDRRVLFAWRVLWPPHTGEWTHDAARFDEITEWREARTHDLRPLIRLRHPPHRRFEWAPAHRFLWFRWGNTTAVVAHEETELAFRSGRDPLFVAVRDRLATSPARHGESFRVELPGTREERLGKGMAVFRRVRFPRLHRLRRWWRDLGTHLHHGRIKWWIRLGSWALLAVPAWFIDPWFVIPAVALVEIAWVLGLQWSWRRTVSPRRVPR